MCVCACTCGEERLSKGLNWKQTAIQELGENNEKSGSNLEEQSWAYMAVITQRIWELARGPVLHLFS